MASPLQPKIVRDNKHPLLQRRLAASANGWTINPSVFKIGCVGWPRLPCDEAAIRTHKQWRSLYHDGTAVRVVGKLAVYDCDVSIDWVADLILDDLFSIDEAAFNTAVVRDSERVSQALFFQAATPFGHYSTHRYTAHPELLPQLEAAYAMKVSNIEDDEDQVNLIRSLFKQLDPQKVETYGPLSKGRHFQYEGTHSEGRQYRCGDRAPWNTKVDDLPPMPLAPDALIERAEAILAANLTLIPDRIADKGGDVVYDLTPETLFFPKDGAQGTIAELAEGMGWGAENGVYGCLQSTLASQSMANCKLFVTTRGRIAVTNWAANGRIHYMAADAPPPPFEIPDQLREALREQQPQADEPRPSSGRSRADIPRGATPEEAHDNAVNWLVEHVAYYPEAFRGKGGAMSIHPDGEFRVPLTVPALRGAMASFGYIEVGPQGGQHVRNPVGQWSAHPLQVLIHGIRTRPDMPRPRFIEDGQELLNRYQPPQHPATGGTIEPFQRRMAALSPDDAERAWFINWARLLVQKPHWRMVAVAMVARDNGAGRGMLAETLQRVLGEPFVVSMPYANISGGSKFNAEVEGKLLLHVNEAAPPESRRFANKNAAREALKDFVEPNHNVPFRVEPKGVDAYYTRASISTLIFTNNLDGLPLDEADRRFAVIMNGPQMSAAEIEDYRAWMEDPVNIGALYRWLRDSAVETDKKVFDPYMAPRFHGKDLMIDAGKTSIDRVWEDATARLRKKGELYTMSQVVALARTITSKLGNNDFDELIEKHTVIHGYRIGVKHSKNWHVRFNPAESGDAADKADEEEEKEGSPTTNKERVYAHNEKGRRSWTEKGPRAIRAELGKAQAAIAELVASRKVALQAVAKG